VTQLSDHSAAALLLLNQILNQKFSQYRFASQLPQLGEGEGEAGEGEPAGDSIAGEVGEPAGEGEPAGDSIAGEEGETAGEGETGDSIAGEGDSAGEGELPSVLPPPQAATVKVTPAHTARRNIFFIGRRSPH
jgi:hypothetical protein